MSLFWAYQLDHCLFKMRNGWKTSYGGIEIIPGLDTYNMYRSCLSDGFFWHGLQEKYEASLDYKDFPCAQGDEFSDIRGNCCLQFYKTDKGAYTISCGQESPSQVPQVLCQC